jgi:hypothetical protein
MLQDELMLRLQLADDGTEQQTLQSSSRMIRAVSTCARDMPQDSSNWDLSHLLIDGQPVSRDTVTAWLNAVHMHMEDAPFPGYQGSPTRDPTQLYQLLAFADAVGSSRGVLRACLPKEELQFGVNLYGRDLKLDAGDNTTVYAVACSVASDAATPCATGLASGSVLRHMGLKCSGVYMWQP